MMPFTVHLLPQRERYRLANRPGDLVVAGRFVRTRGLRLARPDFRSTVRPRSDRAPRLREAHTRACFRSTHAPGRRGCGSTSMPVASSDRDLVSVTPSCDKAVRLTAGA